MRFWLEKRCNQKKQLFSPLSWQSVACRWIGMGLERKEYIITAVEESLCRLQTIILIYINYMAAPWMIHG
jgi:hypothetical protein